MAGKPSDNQVWYIQMIAITESCCYYLIIASYFYIFVVEYKRINMDKPRNYIREVLEEKGIKQTWLAEKLGKSFCMVNSYVCNRHQPSLEVLFEIADILQVDPKDLIESKD